MGPVPLPFSSSSWAASAWAGSAAGELSSMGSPSVQGSHVPLETSLPQEGGCGWSSPVLEAHQVLDQLPHVGVVVHLAELAVEEPVCVALRPARWNSKGGSRGMVSNRTRKGIKHCCLKARESQTHMGKNSCHFGKVSQNKGKPYRSLKYIFVKHHTLLLLMQSPCHKDVGMWGYC